MKQSNRSYQIYPRLLDDRHNITKAKWCGKIIIDQKTFYYGL